jgi:putative polyhydroxyalkanoate system protein
MADIRIHRDHHLGLAQAREISQAWAAQVETKFAMTCRILEGKTSDSVEFSRSGVKGRLVVTADHFELQASLGFLLGAFKFRIEGEVERELDLLLTRAKPANGPQSG